MPASADARCRRDSTTDATMIRFPLIVRTPFTSPNAGTGTNRTVLHGVGVRYP
jgi:hypothetical protein